MSQSQPVSFSSLRHDLGGVLAALRTARELSVSGSDAAELLDLSIERLERMIGELKRELAK